MNESAAARSYWEGTGLTMLLAGLLLGPAAWLFDLQISYSTVGWACRHHGRAFLLAVPVVSLAAVALSAWLAWSPLRKLRSIAHEDGARREDRSYFLALAGLGVNALVALLILTTYLPRIVLSPCE